MQLIRLLLLALIIGSTQAAASSTDLKPLQPLLDAAEPNSTIVLEPGVYAGPVTVEQPITLDGQGKATIDAGGKGSVIFLDSDGATIKNLRLINSGSSHNDIDSGVQVRGNFNVIKDNVIENTLFGVDLQQSEHNIVKRNRISSIDTEMGTRGDAVRLWYSFHNKITDNIIRNSRDMVVWYSSDNTIARNDARGGRYSLHFMYSQYNLVEDNHYEDNAVGIFLMYSDGVVVRNNHIANAAGPTGVGIGFKETSDIVIEQNKVLRNATGLYIDVSPYQPETTNRFRNNLIAYNGVGIRWLNDWTGNIFEGNKLKSNVTQVMLEGGKTANRNKWYGNHWDDYEGFDLDKDDIGDKPYELYKYADRIWMDVPSAQFFKGSPMLEVLDFLERLAPFSDPDLMVRDEKPIMTAEFVSDERKNSKSDSKVEQAGTAGEDEEKSSSKPSSLDLLRQSLQAQ